MAPLGFIKCLRCHKPVSKGCGIVMFRRIGLIMRPVPQQDGMLCKNCGANGNNVATPDDEVRITYKMERGLLG